MIRELPAQHAERMEVQYAEAIELSAEKAVWASDAQDGLYGGIISQLPYSRLLEYTPEVQLSNDSKTEIIMWDATTDCTLQTAVHMGLAENDAVVLNFASSRNPGGGYIKGAMAQEEAICSVSTLYNILIRFEKNVYTYQRENLHDLLYANSLLYTPKVIFEFGTSLIPADVITVAAPNRRAALRHENITDEQVNIAMYDRIYGVLSAAAQFSTRRCLILGAFGCGVFGNDPQATAGIFRGLLTEKFSEVFKTVIFAVPNMQSPNYKAFRDVLDDICTSAHSIA